MTESQPDGAALRQNGSRVFHRSSSHESFGACFTDAEIFTTWPLCGLLPKICTLSFYLFSLTTPFPLLSLSVVLLRFWGFHQNLPPHFLHSYAFLFFCFLCVSRAYALLIHSFSHYSVFSVCVCVLPLPIPLNPINPHYTLLRIFEVTQIHSFHPLNRNFN